MQRISKVELCHIELRALNYFFCYLVDIVRCMLMMVMLRAFTLMAFLVTMTLVTFFMAMTFIAVMASACTSLIRTAA